MKTPKKYTVDQRIKRIEKAIGELYILVHKIINKIEPNSEPETSQTEKSKVE